ncbi:MAG TPA: phosphoenolpyruvate carboxylase, partial [Gemmatimonadaceae bacterium]
MPDAPATRPEDQPLHDDVRLLADALGRVIRRLEGEQAFETVESLRVASRARRRGDAGALTLDALLDRVAALPVESAAVAARAFTLFFLLINTAEQVHRVRRARDYARQGDAEPQPASARWTMRQLRRAGRSADSVREGIARLDVRPVLTAHPTESTRRTLLSLQARVAEILLARDAAAAGEGALDVALDAEVELLWLSAEVRRDRPSVRDEVGTVLWYLETRLLDAGARAREALLRAYEDEYETSADPLCDAVPLHIGTWVGGDRDGNPFVTADVTVAAARRAGHAILGHYHAELRRLVERLSLSASIAPPTEALRESLAADRDALPDVWQANRRRNADEPVRLKLSFMAARIDAARRVVAARDAGRPGFEPAAYADAGAFERDLLLIRDCLAAAGADAARRAMLDPFLATVRAHGFHGFRMDVRDHADAHDGAVGDIAARLGIGALDGDALRRELRGRRPLVAPDLEHELADDTRRVLDTVRA